MANQNPEQIERDNIDKQLTACGWIIQSIKQVNLNARLPDGQAGPGIAVKEHITDVGPVDYLLFIEGKPCGVVLQQTEALRQSILKKAFEGKLVNHKSSGTN